MRLIASIDGEIFGTLFSGLGRILSGSRILCVVTVDKSGKKPGF